MEELKLPGNVTFQAITKQNCLEKQIHFKTLIKLVDDNTFINPPEQTDLNEDKVQEMINAYLKNPEYLIFKNKITIAVLMNKNNNYTLYLVDGQHRIAMAIRLYKEYDISDYLTLCFIKTYSIKEIENIFNECNKDSYKNKIVFDKDVFKKIKYNEMKEIFKNKYSESFSKTKATSHLRYSITEFMDILLEKEYLNNKLSVNELLNDIESKNKKFNKIIDYQGYLENSDYFYKEELNCIHNGIIFVLKNSNFINYLFDQSIIPNHEFKNKRSKNSPKLRIQVWKTKFSDSEEDYCPIYKCENKISNEAFGFEFGMIVSKTNNGQQCLDNLIPMCSSCYNKMGSTDLEEFNKTCKKEYKTSQITMVICNN
jgi:hypothetical protein